MEAAEIEQPTTPVINFDKRVAGPDQTFGVTIFLIFKYWLKANISEFKWPEQLTIVLICYRNYD